LPPDNLEMINVSLTTNFRGVKPMTPKNEHAMGKKNQIPYATTLWCPILLNHCLLPFWVRYASLGELGIDIED